MAKYVKYISNIERYKNMKNRDHLEHAGIKGMGWRPIEERDADPEVIKRRKKRGFDGFLSGLGDKLGDVGKRIDNRFKMPWEDKNFKRKVNKTIKRAKRSIKNMGKDISEGVEKISKSVRENVKDFTRAATRNLTKVRRNIEDTARRVSRNVNDSFDEIRGVSGVEKAKRTVNRAMEDSKRAFDRMAEDTARELKYVKEDTEDAISDTVKKVTKDIEKVWNKNAGKLSKDRKKFTKKKKDEGIWDDIKDVADSAFDEASSFIKEAGLGLATAAGALSGTLDDMGKKFDNMFGAPIIKKRKITTKNANGVWVRRDATPEEAKAMDKIEAKQKAEDAYMKKLLKEISDREGFDSDAIRDPNNKEQTAQIVRVVNEAGDRRLAEKRRAEEARARGEEYMSDAEFLQQPMDPNNKEQKARLIRMLNEAHEIERKYDREAEEKSRKKKTKQYTEGLKKEQSSIDKLNKNKATRKPNVWDPIMAKKYTAGAKLSKEEVDRINSAKGTRRPVTLGSLAAKKYASGSKEEQRAIDRLNQNKATRKPNIWDPINAKKYSEGAKRSQEDVDRIEKIRARKAKLDQKRQKALDEKRRRPHYSMRGEKIW